MFLLHLFRVTCYVQNHAELVNINTVHFRFKFNSELVYPIFTVSHSVTRVLLPLLIPTHVLPKTDRARIVFHQAMVSRYIDISTPISQNNDILFVDKT